MGTKERKEREKEEKRGLILSTAQEIVRTEGIEKLSIRKIADKIEYSPAIIYHYFKDKDDIIHHLMRSEYQKIIHAVSTMASSTGTPEQRLKSGVKSFINVALEMSDAYLSIMLSTSPIILANTSILDKGASGRRQALGILCRLVEEIFDTTDLDFIELTAQILWTSIFGLITRLIIEKNIDGDQRERLINHYLKCMVDGMLLNREIKQS